jgi:ubiquinone/menaquinone biosynthesis C-methylase UbiE
MSTYSEVIFESKVSRTQHPDYIASLIHALSGLAIEWEGGKVLSIGCGTGRSLVPLAIEYPNTTWIGCDYAREPLERGRKLAEICGAKNCAFLVGGTDELKSRDFNLIVVLGVFTWISKVEQEKLLLEISRLLKSGGALLISHNVPPGWQIRDTVRKYLIETLGGIEGKLSHKEQMEYAHSQIAKLLNSISGSSFYNLLLQQELKRLSKTSLPHLFHEYLNPHTSAINVINLAQIFSKLNLFYVGDTRWRRMSSLEFKNLPNGITISPNDLASKLSFNDILNGVSFRESLFVKDSLPKEPLSSKNFLKTFSFASFAHEISNQHLDEVEFPEDIYRVEFNNVYERDVAKILGKAWPNFLNFAAISDLSLFSGEPQRVEQALFSLLRNDHLLLTEKTRWQKRSSLTLKELDRASFTIPAWALASIDSVGAGEYEVINFHYNTVQIGSFEVFLLKTIQKAVESGENNLEKLKQLLSKELENEEELLKKGSLIDLIKDGIAMLQQAVLVLLS